MSEPPASDPPDAASGDAPARRKARWKRALAWGTAVVAVWVATAYLLLPLAWKRYTHRHPAFDDVPNITHTASGIPGDPLNVALVGGEIEVKRILLAAKWYPADPLTLKSCLEIAEAAVLSRPYDDAPVSNLFWDGRKEDLAFEMPVGDNPRRRHHVRFWKTKKLDDGRPVWIGSATYDERVGLSRTTGQVTHHIAPDVDAERDHLISSLKETGELSETYFIDDFHKIREGRNGGGDPWRTDGRLAVGVCAERAPAK